MFKRALLLRSAVLLTLAASACAPAATGGSGRNQDVITAEELETVRANTLHDAITRLRPRWLQVRSLQTFGGSGDTSILVYQNQSRLGGTEVLRQLDVGTAAWLQFLDGPTASASLPGIGSQDVEGAIIIHTTPREGRG